MDRKSPYVPFLISLILGAFYTLTIGFGNLPVHFQSTLLWVILTASIVFLLRDRQVILSKFHYLLLILGTGIAGFASITTSHLLVSVSALSLLFIINYFLLGLFRTSGFPDQATDYASGTLKFSLTAFFEFIFKLLLLKPLNIFMIFGLPKWKISRETGTGLLLSFPVLLIFHVLFANINQEYLKFTLQILEQVFEFIKFILDIDLIVFLIKTLFISYFFYIILTIKESTKALSNIESLPEIKKYIIILTATIGLFALFSYFQSKLLFTRVAVLAFKTLSIYTQQGFWELILVSIFGYSLCLWVFTKINKSHAQSLHLRYLLTFFTAELLLITVFSYHKLFWLQYIFGLKDQRILATLAVVLITGTFILFLLRLFERIGPQKIFTIQAVAFLAVVFLLNLINIDLFLTKTYPISYFVNGVKYKDYSYLLGNSYDNSSTWLSLINEYESKLPPQPEDYYWGSYLPICEKNWNGMPITYLEDRYAYLKEKYGQPESGLTKITQFNFHEYQAYQLIKSHPQVFYEFVMGVKANCNNSIKNYSR